MDLRPTLTLIHVLAALVFVIAHAVSAVAMFQVRGRSDRSVLTATLNRSSKAQIVAYVAAHRLGLVIVPVNTAYGVEEIANVVRNTTPAAAISNATAWGSRS